MGLNVKICSRKSSAVEKKLSLNGRKETFETSGISGQAQCFALEVCIFSRVPAADSRLSNRPSGAAGKLQE